MPVATSEGEICIFQSTTSANFREARWQCQLKDKDADLLQLVPEIWSNLVSEVHCHYLTTILKLAWVFFYVLTCYTFAMSSAVLETSGNNAYLFFSIHGGC